MVGRAEVFGWILEGLHLCMRRRGCVGQLWAREEGRRQSSVEPDLGDGAVSRGSSPSEMAVVGEDSGDHGGTLGLLLALLRGGSRRLEAAHLELPADRVIVVLHLGGVHVGKVPVRHEGVGLLSSNQRGTSESACSQRCSVSSSGAPGQSRVRRPKERRAERRIERRSPIGRWERAPGG